MNKNKEEKNYCVYLHTVLQKTSGYKYKKYYVGITNDIKKRWECNGIKYKNQVFYNAIQKYGWDNIKHRVLYKNLTKEKAMELEKKMIIKYDSKVGHKGYNVSDGGEIGSQKRKNTRNIYCIDTNQFFLNPLIAESITEESRYTILNKCVTHKNKNGNCAIKKGYRYCFADEAYKYIQNLKSCQNILVNVTTKQCNTNRYFMNKNNLKSRVRIKTIEQYLDFIDRGLEHRDIYILLNDYLYLFDTIKFGENQE